MEGIPNLRTPIYFLSIQDCKYPPAKEATVPQIDHVAISNIATGLNWVIGQTATVPDLPPAAGSRIYVNADDNNQPPAGFLNNPAHQYVVQGRYLYQGGAFVSGLLQYNGADSEPPLSYIFNW
jgi:hypothetical protein